MDLGALGAYFFRLGELVYMGGIWGPPQGGAILVINPQIDRPILGFSVNGVAGGNVSAYDPSNIYAGIQGGTTCGGGGSGIRLM
ncbi:hypothetical protein LHV18_01110 [Providencia rettgeri]|uniref:hypothetical protein n=1 Tax=Providencia rettgeri TaxID=587 RepID=UPI001CFDF4A0|nr:hypothetical protein [Providencia rettgeri]MCB4839234.1 hypothetical protein [Providencia rettgeri]